MPPVDLVGVMPHMHGRGLRQTMVGTWETAAPLIWKTGASTGRSSISTRAYPRITPDTQFR